MSFKLNLRESEVFFMLLLFISAIILFGLNWAYNGFVSDYNNLSIQLRDCQARLNYDIVPVLPDSVLNTEISYSQPVTNKISVLNRFYNYTNSFLRNKSYNRSSYNCVNVSNDFYLSAPEDQGFTIGIRRGCNSTICHRYNVVTFEFETFDGTFSLMKEKYPINNYEVNI